jgi:hypothetical protein
MELILRSILPIELTNGNTGRGHKFWASSKARKDAEKIIRANGLTRKPFDFPVTVRVTRMFRKGQRPWDSSSVGRGNWKEIEDALVACGWFHDDSYKWIRSTEFDQKTFSEACVMVEVFKFLKGC